MLVTHSHLTLIERLDRHPLLRSRVESLLAVVEDAAGDCEQANVAERRVIEELRQMGNEALTAWAERGVEKQTGLAQVEPNWRSGGKKKLYWYTTFGPITVMEPLWRNGTGIERPFSVVAGVECRGSSLPLQRVMTDFGADDALRPGTAKLKEHYGIDMPVSTVQRTTEHHAEGIYAQDRAREIEPGTVAGCLIGEMDGSMVPVVEPASAVQDHRKGKKLSWKEVRLNLVHPKGSVTPVFGGNFAGGVEESGRQWERCAAKAGFGPQSQLHAVGDGAPWIADQVDQHFGTQGSYLVDFFHLCEYLAEASPVCGTDDPPAWLDQQKDRLKANQSALVLAALAPFIEADSDAPVAACDRYLRNRLDQLDYQGAIQQGLPIGSGEIESAHRYIIQKRLKLPGAWWSSAPIETLLALRLNRANQEWEAYWQGLEKQAAGTGQTVVASL